MSAYVNVSGEVTYSGNSMRSVYVYPNYVPQETARVVETTVEEYFDEDGKLSSRTTKTVTRYEKTPQYQVWNGNPNTQVLPCTSKPFITNVTN